jgi:hypothetical protein
VAALKRISELFAGDPGGDIQLAAMARLHEAVDAEPARDYFRTARLLIGLAASVLIIGTVWLSQTPATSPRLQRWSIASVHTQDWEMVALNPRSYTPPNGMTSIPGDESRYAEAEVIHYMLQNLEGGPSHGNP